MKSYQQDNSSFPIPLSQFYHSFSSSHKNPAASRNNPKNHPTGHGCRTVVVAAGAVIVPRRLVRSASACCRAMSSGPCQAAESYT